VADNMFVQPSVNIGGKRPYTVLISIVAHTLVLAAAIMVPLVATDSVRLPTRLMNIDVFPIQPPLPPSPPLPRGPAKQQLPIVKPTIVVEAPEGMSKEIPIRQSEPLAEIEHNTGLVQGDDYSAAPPSLPPAPVRVQAPVPVGGDIKPPMKVKDATPAYPAVARAAQVQGIVIIQATIGPDGKVQDARVLRSVRLLDEAALDAVRQWEYTPTLLNGMPIAIVMTVTVNFRLQ
jgi:protein TonB